MKSFTIKDLLTHYCPCYSCGNDMEVFIGAGSNKYYTASLIRDYLQCELYRKYNSFLNIYICLTNNTFYTTNLNSFKKWFSSQEKMWLLLQCDKCLTSIESSSFEFDFEKIHIKPLFVSYENIFFIEKDIHLYSSYFDGHEYCEFKISDVNDFKVMTPPKPFWSFNYKNKNKLFNKINTYITFS